VPPVIYGVFPFAVLSMNPVCSDPTALILHDRAFQLSVILWVGLAMGIVVYGTDIQAWVQQPG
jgi:hypothetical protein